MTGIAAWIVGVLLAQADPGGQPVELMVLREVTGDTAKPGSPVTLSVNKAVTVTGGVIPYGTPAYGEVVSADHSGVAMRRGAIAIRLTRLVVAGRDVPLTGDYSSQGREGSGGDAVKLLFVPVYALLSPGNAGRVKAGQVIAGRLPPGFTLAPTTAPAP